MAEVSEAEKKAEEEKKTDVEKTIEALNARVNELSKMLEEKKGLTEEKIKENPYAYLMGAFIGGLILGFMMSRKD